MEFILEEVLSFQSCKLINVEANSTEIVYSELQYTYLYLVVFGKESKQVVGI